VLNSHHKFLLSYAAPVVWNAAMIATLWFFGANSSLPRLAVLLAWGSWRAAPPVRGAGAAGVARGPDLRFALNTTSDTCAP